MANRAERRNNISEVLNKKPLEERVKMHTQITAIMSVFAFAGFVCSLICVCLLAMNKAAQDELNQPPAWVECTLENDVGYSVIADWSTTGVDNTVMFTPVDGEALAVATQAVTEINSNTDVLCTKDNLDEYLRYSYAVSMHETGIELESYNVTEYPVLGVNGRLVKTVQYVVQDNIRVPTYASALYFIYEDYLYSFTYTVAARNYLPDEFDEVLRSIRIIPEAEKQVIIPDKEAAQNIISDYDKFFDNVGVTSTSEADNTSKAEE